MTSQQSLGYPIIGNSLYGGASVANLGYPIIDSSMYGGVSVANLGYNTYSNRYIQPGAGPRFDKFKRGLKSVGKALLPVAGLAGAYLAAQHLNQDDMEPIQEQRDRAEQVARLGDRMVKQDKLKKLMEVQEKSGKLMSDSESFADLAAQLRRKQQGRGKKKKRRARALK